MGRCILIFGEKFYVLVIILSELMVPLLNAQNSNLKTLSFLQIKKDSYGVLKGTVNPLKYNKLKEIYNKLIQTKGDFRTPIPKLVLKNVEESVASIDYNSLEIVIEEKAYDICAKYGEGAIAFLLAHELTHYYERHAWKNEFAIENSDLRVGQSVNKIEDQIINESQADCLGGFMSYSSGYSIDFNAEQVLNELYSAYKMDQIIPGYPTLSERVQLLKRSSDKLNSMIEVFNMANLLCLTGLFKESIAYYEYILMRYQSREIINNLGVVYLMQALQFFDAEELKYKYPIEMDIIPMNSRDAGSVREREALLREALHQFNIAIGMDPNYLPSILNKAIAYSILGELDKAQFYCEQEIISKSEGSEFSKTITDAIQLIGIIYDQKKQKELAVQNLNKAIQRGSDVAKYNLEIVNGSIKLEQPNAPKNQSSQKLNGVMILDKFSDAPLFDDEKVKTINSTYSFKQFTNDSLDYVIYFNYNDNTEEINYFMLMNQNSTSSTELKINIGSSSEEVSQKYGKPNGRIESVQGSIWVYDQLYFIIGRQNSVIRWGSYFTKKAN